MKFNNPTVIGDTRQEVIRQIIEATEEEGLKDADEQETSIPTEAVVEIPLAIYESNLPDGITPEIAQQVHDYDQRYLTDVLEGTKMGLADRYADGKYYLPESVFVDIATTGLSTSVHISTSDSEPVVNFEHPAAINEALREHSTGAVDSMYDTLRDIVGARQRDAAAELADD